MNMKTYKIVHQDGEKIVVENEYDNYPDAIISLENSIYMEPFIIIDDGTLDVKNMVPDEARHHAIERIQLSQNYYYD